MRVNIQNTASILQRLVNMVVARTELNDLNRGSAMLQVLGAVSNEIELCYLEVAQLLSLFSIDSANGDDLDALALLYLPVGLRRKEPLKSFGRGRFALVEPATSALVIPVGAVVRNPSTGQDYTTTQEATINVGENQSNLVLFESLETGDQANTNANTITQIMSGGRGANSFFQTVATGGGRGRETDEELRIRIRRRVSSLAFSTNQALEGRVLDAESNGRRVISSRIIEDTSDRGFCRLYIDDGSPVIDALLDEEVVVEILDDSTDENERNFFTEFFPLRRGSGLVLQLDERNAQGGFVNTQNLLEGRDFYVVHSQGRIVLSNDIQVQENSRLIVLSYTRQKGLVESAQILVEGSRDGTLPMYRASGVVIEVIPASKILISVDANIVVNDGFDRPSVLTEVKTSINSYVNTLGISDDVVISEIIERAMRVQGMYDITINSPTDNITVAFDEVARILFDDIEVQ